MHKVTLERVKFGTMHGLIAEYEGKGAECRFNNIESAECTHRLAEILSNCGECVSNVEIESGESADGVGIVIVSLDDDDDTTFIERYESKIDADAAAKFLEKFSQLIESCTAKDVN